MVSIGFDAEVVRWTNSTFMGEDIYIFGDVNRVEKLPHSRTRYNMVFVDGHVEAIKMNELFGVALKYRVRWNNDHLP